MEKLPMCRICLVQDVRMFVVVNKNLRELYEKLTDIPFVTEDSRPIHACFICFTKLKQCYRLLRQCLEAEELLAQKVNEYYENNLLINQDHFEFYSGFIKSSIENISIVDECQTESIAIKVELSAVCEEFDDTLKPKEECQSDELEPDNSFRSCLDVVDISPHHSESDLEDDLPLTEIKIEVEQELEVSEKKQRAWETRRVTVAKKPKQDTRRPEPENATTANQTPDIRTTQKCTSKPDICFKEPLKSDQCFFNQVKEVIQHTRTRTDEKPFKCDVCQRSFSKKCNFKMHIRTHTGEKPFKCEVCQRSFSAKESLIMHIRIHTGEKPYKCDVCQRCFSMKNNLANHIRIHTGEKPYKCNVCQCSFSLKGILNKHIRVHTGEKPFKCDVCPRSFSNKYNLTRHKRIHTGEKPYMCDVCQRSFSDKSNLTNHARIHTGEKS